ncbi:MAG: UDP binding domain-containing protein, partial [Chitinophagales bacterium]
MVRKMSEFFKGKLEGKMIAIWGIAFKPNTDDIREAPSLYIINELLNKGCKIAVYDPEALENLKKTFRDKIEYHSDIYSPLKGADALMILTEWSLFRTPDFEKISSLMRENVIFDGRNLYNLDQIEDHGFYYNSIGRKTVMPQKGGKKKSVSTVS